jgi:DNA-binding MarR family transcriptional regulator
MDADAVARLRRVVSRLSRDLNAPATAQGLTPAQASVLGLVAARGPLGIAELIDLEGINPTMLSRVIGKLHQAGLVSRAPDPGDLRAVTVAVTARGRAVHRRIQAQRTALVSARLAGLPPRQAQAIEQALPALEALAGVDALSGTLP